MKLFLLFSLLTICYFNSISQNKDSINYSKYTNAFMFGMEDASSYLKEYLGNSLLANGYGLSSGLYNTAKSHQVLGFSFNASFGYTVLPAGRNLMKFNPKTYKNISLVNENGNVIDSVSYLPTVLDGSTKNKIVLKEGAEITDPETGEKVKLTDFGKLNLVDGAFYDSAANQDDQLTGVFSIPFQLNVGTFKKTDLIIRVIPEFGINDFQLHSFGFGLGLKHNINQWFPRLRLSSYDFAAFMGLTGAILIKDLDYLQSKSLKITDGNLTFFSSSFTFQGLVSRDFSIFTPYLGVGFVTSSSSLNATGTYKYSDSTGATATFKDPINLDFEGRTEAKLNAGLRIKLLAFTFHLEYAFQRHSSINTGIGITIR